MDLQTQIFELKMRGNCCSQIIMELALDDMELENKGLVRAMRGLCNGLQIGSICGTLSAASCLLFMMDPEKAQTGMNQELTDWFLQSFKSLDCRDLVGDDMMARLELCPVIMEKTYEKILELMDMYQITFEAAALSIQE